MEEVIEEIGLEEEEEEEEEKIGEENISNASNQDSNSQRIRHSAGTGTER
jgi:hypothetical protein